MQGLDHIDRYDWVILGGTEAARQGAEFAANQGARVALVEAIAQTQDFSQDFPRLGQLMRAGVDVMLEDWLWERSPIAGKFSRLWSRRPPWLVRTETRWLWGDRYLYAQPRSPQVPRAIQQSDRPLLFPADLDNYLAQRSQDGKPKKHWAVLGGDIAAIACAQRLARGGDQVILLLPNHCLVPGLFSPADRYLQNLLETDGIDIVWDVPLETFTPQDLPQETDSILVATRPKPLASENGPRFATHHGQAIASPYLQTSLSYFYLCGPALGGYSLPAIAEAEVLTAIAHGLGQPSRAIDYSTLPWTIPTDPSITQWGKTTPQYNRPVLEIPCDDGGLLWLLWEKKWRSQSKIVGAAGVGQEAQRAIATLANLLSALGRSPTFDDLRKLPVPPANLVHLRLMG
ncbi:MAG: hypothetical protein AAGF75_07915 [Cyanobacteria bacterium P01_H01_bin.130]